MTDLATTAPDTPTTTLEHPIRSAPVSRSRVRPRGRRRGDETAVVGVLLLAIAVMIAALGYLAGGPPLRRTVPLGRQPDPVTTTTTLSSRGTSPTARREASPVAAASPHAAAVTGDTQPAGSSSRGDAADSAGSGAQIAVEARPPAGAPVPAADQPAATTTTGPPPAVEPPAPAETTSTTGPPPTQPPPTEPPPVTVPPAQP